MRIKTWAAACSIAGALALAGCGGGSSKDGDGSPQLHQTGPIKIQPIDVALLAQANTGKDTPNSKECEYIFGSAEQVARLVHASALQSPSVRGTASSLECKYIIGATGNDPSLTLRVRFGGDAPTFRTMAATYDDSLRSVEGRYTTQLGYVDIRSQLYATSPLTAAELKAVDAWLVQSAGRTTIA